MASLGAVIGPNTLPADPTGLTEGAHAVTDKGLGVLLDLLSTAIVSECGALYLVLFPDGVSAVQARVPFDVLEWDDLMQFDHPSICVSSVGDGEKVLDLDGRRAKVSTITVRYLLKQLSPDEFVKANGFLNGVENTIRAVLMHGYHPDYNSGFQSLYGEKSAAKYSSLEVLDALKPHVVAGTDIRLPSLQVRISAVEIVSSNPDYTDTLSPLTGIDADLDLGPSDDEIAPFVQTSTNFP